MSRFFISIVILIVVGCVSKKSEDTDQSIDHRVDEGIQFKAYAKVNSQAFDRAVYIVREMLKKSSEIKQRMVDTGFVIDIIGRSQKISDLPRYHDLKDKKTFDGRSFDDGTRGVGNSDACSVGEENLLCESQQLYWEENILVHEFAHSIKFHMTKVMSDSVDQAYLSAQKNKLYPNDIYMMANSDEYWAEATQAWFNATVRRDVNAGINTRNLISQHDPEISKILMQIYGEVEINRSKNCRY